MNKSARVAITVIKTNVERATEILEGARLKLENIQFNSGSEEDEVYSEYKDQALEAINPALEAIQNIVDALDEISE